jgi:branched-chain amino acid transport system substrate-binding protein
MKNFVRRLCSVSATLAVLLPVFAINFATSASAAEPVRLGAAVSLTGNLAKLGQETKQGYELWMEQVNANGGLNVAGVKRPVKIIFYDDQSNAIRATKLVEKLISQDNVKLILGPYSSGITLPVSTITEKNHALLMSAGGNADDLFKRNFHYIFGIWPLASEPIQTTLEVIHKADPKLKTVGIAVKDNLFSLTAAKGARAKAKELGLKLVLDEKYPAEVNDFSALINKAKQVNPDILVELGHLKEAILFVKQSKELGFSPKAWTLQPGPENPDFKSTLGSGANYVFWYALWSAAVEYKDPVFGTTDNYVNRYQARYKVAPTFNSAAATAGAELFGLAIQIANSTDPDKVENALRSFKGETIMGPVQFDKRGVNINARKNVVVYQIQNGKDVLVAPAAVAKGAAKLPMPGWGQR